jgi:uncharacterized membrane protein/mono/diheme cytochrome c family protein
MIRLLHRALLFLFAVGAAQAAEIKPAPKEEQLKIAQHVRDIFEAKCLDCHGPELPRPKGKFGYTLDLKRIAENPDYVVRGDAEASEIYVLVRDDEMPGEDANVPPLTKEEKEAVRRWVEIGAPHELPAGAEKEPASVSVAETGGIEMPTWKRLIRWIGRFHPVSTHFPVGLMMVAVVAEALAWWTRRESWMQTVRFLVILGAAGAIMAAGLGWVNASFTSYVGSSASILKWHRWLGTFTAVWTVACATLCVISECREGSPDRQRFRGALLLGAALVGISGFLGSALIYGLDHYAW